MIELICAENLLRSLGFHINFSMENSWKAKLVVDELLL